MPNKHGKVVLSEYAKMLLIKRARLVSGAAEKIDVLRELMQDHKDDNHMLVYCGATTMHDVDYKEGKAHIDDIRQIDLVADMLGNDLGMRVSKFTSEENAAERERIKADFDAGDHLQAVVAIRCLDEGVNIPSIKQRSFWRAAQILRSMYRGGAECYDSLMEKTLPLFMISSPSHSLSNA